MKKIAVFVDAFLPYFDGVVNVVINYYNILSKYFDITVFVPDYKDCDYSFLKFKVFKVKSYKNIFDKNFPIPLPYQDKNLKKYLQENKFDLVHVHSPFVLGKYGLEYANKNNIYSLITIHSQYKKDFKLIFKSNLIANYLVYKFVIKNILKANELVNVNKNMENLILNDYKLNKYLKNKNLNFSIFSNATNFKLIDNESKIKAINEVNNNLQINNNTIVFSFVGRVVKLKNIDLLIETINVLKNKIHNFKVLVIGTGNYLKKSIKKVKQLNLENYIIFLNKIDNQDYLIKLINRSFLNIFLSEYDTNTLTKFEFASQKVPSLFLKDTITSSNIIDNVNGYLVEKDCNKIANKILDIINSTKYFEVKENAYKQIYLNWDTVVENQLLKHYLSLTNKK